MKSKRLLILLIIILIVIIAIVIFSKVSLSNEEDNVDVDYSAENSIDVYLLENEDEEINENNNTNYVPILSEEAKADEYSLAIKKYEYTFKKPELHGLKLKILNDRQHNIEDGFLYTECRVRVDDSIIKKVQIEKFYDDKNQIEFLDKNKNTKSEFENGETIVIKCPDNTDFSVVDYKFTVEFVHNGKTYKSSVTTGLVTYFERYGRVEATFYKPGTKDLLIGGQVRFDKIFPEYNKIEFIGDSKTGRDGKVIFTNVPVGQYKLTKVINGNDVESKTFEIKPAETTTVEF